MNEATAVLIFLALFVFGSLLVVAGVIVVGILVFRIMRSTSRQVGFAGTQQPVQQGEDFLASTTLRPWTSEAWTDLSSRWEGWWRNITHIGREDGYAQGVVKSLQEPDGPGWLAFTVQRQQLRNGVVILRTSDQRVELRVNAESRLDPNVQVDAWLDGAPAGSITVDFPSCTFRSTDGEIEARWNWDLRWNNEIRVLNRVTSRDLFYDPIEVNGRTIAALIDTWIRYPHPESDKPIPPALQSVAEDLTAPEQEALLIVLAMGLYYDTLRKHLRRRTDVIYDW